TVLPANDSPTFTPVASGATNPPGDTVAALIGGSITDADGDAVGIAVVGAKSTGGVWEYRLNGAGLWSPLTAASAKLAVPLQPDDEVRYVPKGTFQGTAKLMYRGWDQTLGTAGTPIDATKADAFSATVHTATISVGGTAAANASPHLNTTATPVLTSMLEDTPGLGDPVTTLLGSAFSDPDAGAKQGVAVVAVTGAADGQWQYSTTGGKKWVSMGAISGAHALLLRDTDRVRFVPNLNFVGTRVLTFRAWDQTEGSAGQYADLTLPGTTGGTGAVSPESDTAAVTVLPANDSPTFTTLTPARFTPQAKGEPNPPGNTVASLIGSTVVDPDAGDPQGIAVTKIDTTPGGVWEYRLNAAGTWQAIPTSVEPGFALALHADAEIRFLADSTYEGTRALSFVAWDYSAWESGNQVPAVGLGFSKAVRTGLLTVTPGNVRPILDPKGVKPLTSVLPDATAPDGDPVSALLANAVVDPDGADPQGIAVTLADSKNGRWEFSLNGGANWQAVTGVTKKTALLLRATD
ncbi:MAG TPA: hypothetical protein VM597_26640, partial [Gemmataceae bacterium]|nr:hypothetical protein [Gemmataceae bacterium]